MIDLKLCWGSEMHQYGCIDDNSPAFHHPTKPLLTDPPLREAEANATEEAEAVADEVAASVQRNGLHKFQHGA